MSYTRSRGTGSVTTSQRTQIQPVTPVDEDGGVKCTGHARRCKQMTAGPTSKNPGRAFYACPLSRDDPNKCKFFKWADELHELTPQAGTSRAARLTAAMNQSEVQGGQTLGQSPQSRFGKPTTPIPSRIVAVPITPRTGPTANIIGDEDEEIDWEKVDTDDLEREAIASTPASSQRTDQGEPGSLGRPGTQTSFADRLRAEEYNSGKRKRDEDSCDMTPKRTDAMHGESNPFLSPSHLSSHAHPVHPAISPSLTSLEQLSEHLHRQDRLIKAGELAKDGFRKRIKALEERNRLLEEKIKQLEA